MSVKKIHVHNLSEYGEVLSTRERGREAADRLQDALSKGHVVISFAGVEVATPSFIDELLTRLRAVLQTDEEAIALISGMNEDTRESMRLVVEHRGWTFGVLDKDHVELLGGKKHLQETLAKAQELGTFKATELADALEIKLPNLHQRLKALRQAGVVGRKLDETAQRGRRHEYDVINTKELAGV